MVAVQAHCSVDEAFVMLEERSRITELTMQEVAESVVDRKFRFSLQA
jgi:AmiR/NasT family two-component response regulator